MNENKCGEICLAGTGAELSIRPCISADKTNSLTLIVVDESSDLESNSHRKYDHDSVAAGGGAARPPFILQLSLYSPAVNSVPGALSSGKFHNMSNGVRGDNVRGGRL